MAGGGKMNRRKFLKFLSFTPIIFLAPIAIIGHAIKKNKPIKTEWVDTVDPYETKYINLTNETGDGGYLVPDYIAAELQKALFKGDVPRKTILL